MMSHLILESKGIKSIFLYFNPDLNSNITSLVVFVPFVSHSSDRGFS